MGKAMEEDLAAQLEQVQSQLSALQARLQNLEGAPGAAGLAAGQAEITEEEVLAISAALAAYFGVRVHVKQIRLVSSRAWAQEGRVSIQASHRLHS
jgi:methylmalonyl-CoA carboxyltransferase large subunit